MRPEVESVPGGPRSTEAPSQTGRPRTVTPLVRRGLEHPELGLLLFIVAIGIVIYVANGNFGTTQNLTNLTRQGTVLAVLAAGQLFVILVGGIDISIASVMAVSSVIGVLLADRAGVTLAFVIAASAGLLVGAINGFAVSYLGLSPIVITIAMLQILLGVALWLSGSKPIYPSDTESYRALAASKFFGIPVMALVALAVLLTSNFVLKRTTFGRSVYAVGGNGTAAFLAGINVRAVMLTCYMISGLLAGVAGVLLSSRVTTGAPDLGSDLVFATFAAVFIGGVRWGGGQGSVLGVALGAILLTIIANALDLFVAPEPVQTIVSGALIALAVGLDRLRGRA